MWLEQHLRHRWGYGVHSPFLYRVVREAMMPRRLVGSDSRLYEALLAQGVGKRTARRLQNLLTLEDYGAWSIDSVAAGEKVLMIATEACDESTLWTMHGALGDGGCALCILHKGSDRRRRELCRRVAMSHWSMSAEGWNFMLLFSRKDLRKQHIVI